MKKTILLMIMAAVACMANAKGSDDVLHGLMERIAPGLSQRIAVEVQPGADSIDWFEITARDGRPLILGNNAVSVATGLNWYLKYYTGNHLCWGNMTATLPASLPLPDKPERRQTDKRLRYYLNYCTLSYSMAFWDWERWQQELDWMALHGVNLPLAAVGMEPVWRNVLLRLGYPEEKINDFVAGPGFQAWWLMNNLEGWGGPNTPEYYDRQERLQKQIVGRMREYGMEPVFAGYAGILPHDAGRQLDLNVADPGLWMSYTRPSFLLPSDKDFQRIADVYYQELTKLYGAANYYSMDPFHEGGRTKGVDLAAAGRAIMEAMKRQNPDAVWVIQGWRANPRAEMIDSLPQGDLLCLDLHAETEPQWLSRPNGYGHHDWAYCMLHNFGGNVGLYGRITSIIREYPEAERKSSTLKGIGLTMEGIETNPVVYELMTEMSWRSGEDLTPERWTADYARARYGGQLPAAADSAWQLLLRSVYDCPSGNTQQGTAESPFTARPSDNPRQASAWAQYTPYYDFADVARAARLLLEAAPELRDNANYLYDVVDVTRQTVADRGRQVAAEFRDAAERGDSAVYRVASQKFLRLIELQDSLLATHPDFRLGRWTTMARNCSVDPAEKDRWEWNARTQITTWGNRDAANRGKLHDYSNREWQGLLRDFYLPRWQTWFDLRLNNWPYKPSVDFFALEQPWTLRHNPYSPHPSGDPVAVASAVLRQALAL